MGTFSSLLLVALVVFQSAKSAEFSTVLALGYGKGVTVQASGMASNFARNFPLGVEFSVGWETVAAGKAVDARRIFVNEATNGTPESSGSMWVFRLDLLYKVPFSGPKATFLYGGVRRSYFDGTFSYVGGNEEFDVTSLQWGFGVGAKTYFEITNKLDLSLNIGVDGFLNGTMHGHDSTYSPDNSNVNPKEKFTYTDASKAVYTPRIAPIVTFGITYGL